MQILVLNGVNLDMLGARDPAVYGGLSSNELETQIYEWAHELDLSVRCRQTNSEGEYIGWIHDAYGDADGLIVNPGAWSHYSYAIHDALEILKVPLVEVHLSNIHEREEWRRTSVVADLMAQRVIGKGPDGLPRGARLPRRPGRRRDVSRLDLLRARLEQPLLVTSRRQHPLPDRASTARTPALLVDPDRPVRLFTDFRYIEEAQAVTGVEVELAQGVAHARPGRAARRPHLLRGGHRSVRRRSRCSARAGSSRCRRPASSTPSGR